MKKLMTMICILLGLAVLILAPATVYASPPEEISGTYEFGETTIVEVHQAGGNVIIKDITQQTLQGDVAGTGIFERTFILHSNGNFNVQGIITIYGSIGGRSGTITQRVVAAGDVITGTVQGRYIVLSATGELANMRGEGTLTGISNVAGTYSGKVHFDPK